MKTRAREVLGTATIALMAINAAVFIGDGFRALRAVREGPDLEAAEASKVVQSLVPAGATLAVIGAPTADEQSTYLWFQLNYLLFPRRLAFQTARRQELERTLAGMEGQYVLLCPPRRDLQAFRLRLTPLAEHPGFSLVRIDRR